MQEGKMPNFNFERFELQDLAMDIGPKDSLLGDGQLIGPLGSRQSVQKSYADAYEKN
jgi:hypothetical protein